MGAILAWCFGGYLVVNTLFALVYYDWVRGT